MRTTFTATDRGVQEGVRTPARTGRAGHVQSATAIPSNPEPKSARLRNRQGDARTAGEFVWAADRRAGGGAVRHPARCPDQPAAPIQSADSPITITAAKPGAKLVGPPLPASLKQHDKAVARATAEHEQPARTTRPANRPARRRSERRAAHRLRPGAVWRRSSPSRGSPSSGEGRWTEGLVGWVRDRPRPDDRTPWRGRVGGGDRISHPAGPPDRKETTSCPQD